LEEDINQGINENREELKEENEINLFEFLIQQREKASKSKNRTQEDKISLLFHKLDADSQLQRKYFVIKTCQLNIKNEENNSKFMHIFVETTQIIQLEKAKAQNNYQRQMLANVSHEFRTPLNAMNMSLIFLKDSVKGLNEKFVKIAFSSCTILSGLVEDILDHAKIQAGVFEIQQTVFKPFELLNEVEEIFELQVKKKGIKLLFELDASL